MSGAAVMARVARTMVVEWEAETDEPFDVDAFEAALDHASPVENLLAEQGQTGLVAAVARARDAAARSDAGLADAMIGEPRF